MPDIAAHRQLFFARLQRLQLFDRCYLRMNAPVRRVTVQVTGLNGYDSAWDVVRIIEVQQCSSADPPQSQS
jgi:hypothetical protein